MSRFANIILHLKRSKQIVSLKDLAEKMGYNYSYLSRVKNNPELFTEELRDNLGKHFYIPNKQEEEEEEEEEEVANYKHLSEEDKLRRQLSSTEIRVRELEKMNIKLQEALLKMVEESILK